jgi:ribosomal protein S18 acetylase RimI-like enzyme
VCVLSVLLDDLKMWSKERTTMGSQIALFLLQVPGGQTDSGHALADGAYAFHSKLASTNPNLKPRRQNDMRLFAERGELFGVREGKDGEWIAVGYAVMHEDESEYEIGGLAVSDPFRSCGVGETLAHIVIAHVISHENPFSYSIVAYVHTDNKDPIPLLKSLGFEKVDRVPVSTTEGTEYRHKFRLSRSAIRQLADWLDTFNGLLGNKKYRVETDLDLDSMRNVLRAEAARTDER